MRTELRARTQATQSKVEREKVTKEDGDREGGREKERQRGLMTVIIHALPSPRPLSP